MKTKLLLLGVGLVLSFRALTQSDIPAWQAAHPDLIFIDEKDLSKFEPLFLETYERQIIVFRKAITQADIDGWTLREKARPADLPPSAPEQQEQLVKDWRGMNQDIKVIPLSVAQQMDNTQRAQLEADGALFLIGEKLTIEDIQAYSH